MKDKNGTKYRSPRHLSLMAKEMFSEAPLHMRKLQQWRPFICPYELLLPHIEPGSSVLDIGCGGGLFLGLLISDGYAVFGTGFDTASRAIEVAGKMARRLERGGAPGHLTFSCLRVQDSWPQGRYDAVCMIDVIHHVPPALQREFFLQAVSMLAPGGRFVFKDMCRRPRWRALANSLHDAVVARERIHYVPMEDVEKWAAEAKLTLIHKENANRLWYGHELRVFSRATPCA